jgi:hypothetical protein
MTAQQRLSRITTGTAIILRGIAWAGEWSETLARWFLAALVGSIAACAVALHLMLAPVVLLAWCGAALTAAGPAAEDDGQEDGEPEDDGPPLDDAAFVELVHDVARGGNVHLNAIRLRLAEELPAYEWTAPDVTALCETAGIPTRKGVRVPGAQPPVTTGIHHTDLPPLPSPTSDQTPVGVVGAGQHSNNNTNATVESIGEGAAMIVKGPSIRQGVRR